MTWNTALFTGKIVHFDVEHIVDDNPNAIIYLRRETSQEGLLTQQDGKDLTLISRSRSVRLGETSYLEEYVIERPGDVIFECRGRNGERLLHRFGVGEAQGGFYLHEQESPEKTVWLVNDERAWKDPEGKQLVFLSLVPRPTAWDRILGDSALGEP